MTPPEFMIPSGVETSDGTQEAWWQSPWFVVGGWLLAMGIALLAWLRPLATRKQLGYVAVGRRVMKSNEAADLLVTYRGQPQRAIAVTSIRLGNLGRGDIRGKDLLSAGECPAGYVRFSCEPQSRMLHCTMYSESETVKPTFELHDFACDLAFQRLQQDEIAEYVIVHTLEEEDTAMSIVGGVEDGEFLDGDSIVDRSDRRLLLSATVAAGAILIVRLWAAAFAGATLDRGDFVDLPILCFFVGWWIWIFAISVRYVRRKYRRLRSQRSGLTLFEDENSKAEYPL